MHPSSGCNRDRRALPTLHVGTAQRARFAENRANTSCLCDANRPCRPAGPGGRMHTPSRPRLFSSGARGRGAPGRGGRPTTRSDPAPAAVHEASPRNARCESGGLRHFLRDLGSDHPTLGGLGLIRSRAANATPAGMRACRLAGAASFTLRVLQGHPARSVRRTLLLPYFPFSPPAGGRAPSTAEQWAGRSWLCLRTAQRQVSCSAGLGDPQVRYSEVETGRCASSSPRGRA